ncbi:hypothetical protein MNB_SM-7-311 [hydrothermal vent metagenome]|uniref:FxsA protein n=1 Tax=hydrothermal vent metagenome TaxID=652676 RepID=A0A1W1BCU4_9ZZZZ
MIYFLLYLLLETLVSVNIASAIGGFATFFEIIITAFIGISILSNFRDTFLQNLMAVSYAQIDVEEFERLNLFTVIGAILLILPGFLTDIIGALLQFSAVTTMLVNRYGVKSKQKKYEEPFYKESDDDVIDVEIIEKHDTIK